jgi:dienelactone hydrolase
MFAFLARASDRLLSRWLAKRVGLPGGPLPRPTFLPQSPEEIPWPEPIEPDLQLIKDEHWKFTAKSPVLAACPESGTIHGRLLGPQDASSVVIVLHGAYGEYTPCEMMGRCFVPHGFRVLIPAAPYHLERAQQGVYSGSMFFWSSELVASGVAQWLAEVRGLIDWLRLTGVKRIGLVGYSIGSLTAGLAATLWPDLEFVVVLAPVGHHLEAIDRSDVAAGFWPWMRNVSPQDKALLDRFAPRFRPPVVRNLLFLVTLFDQIQPLELQQGWRHDWNNPPERRYRHGHISICFTRCLYRDLREFAAQISKRREVSAAVREERS